MGDTLFTVYSVVYRVYAYVWDHMCVPGDTLGLGKVCFRDQGGLCCGLYTGWTICVCVSLYILKDCCHGYLCKVI